MSCVQAALGRGRSNTQELTVLDGLNGVLKPVSTKQQQQLKLAGSVLGQLSLHLVQGYSRTQPDISKQYGS